MFNLKSYSHTFKIDANDYKIYWSKTLFERLGLSDCNHPLVKPDQNWVSKIIEKILKK